jgi:hypothetical protein
MMTEFRRFPGERSVALRGHHAGLSAIGALISGMSGREKNIFNFFIP